MQVGIALIVPTTLLMFGIGAGLLAVAARRSRAWVRAVVVAAALFTLASVSGPLSTADDTASGVLLALMHVVTGAAFLVTAARVAAR
jgi:peptidoglycan/LPS O-acetylase OafA/YrhL